jgi:UDP-N-acetylglucosamine diphosphorylase/glucosamine-1-phosphate N-acetyltransferase
VMNIVLFDEALSRANLLPLTFTRPVCEIRIGILTIREKWERTLPATAGYLTQAYLSKKFPLTHDKPCIFINGKICPSPSLVESIQKLQTGQALYKAGELLAFYGTAEDAGRTDGFKKSEFNGDLLAVDHVWDIFRKNGAALLADFELITRNRSSHVLSHTVTVIGDRNLVFLEDGAHAEACILNTTEGPVYLGNHAEIMEGSVVRGPFALGEHSALKLAAKVYGPSTVGPYSKVGGEMNNSVIFGYSNKAHDGFLGNSVIGEWCNLGADTNNSNLKNNYGSVKLFNYAQQKQVDTGLQFCGLIMGDHSKSGINTMFNTGTVVGVGANIYGGGFPPTHIPGFSWGGADGFEAYRLDKLAETATKMFERRGLVFNDQEQEILQAVFEQGS